MWVCVFADVVNGVCASPERGEHYDNRASGEGGRDVGRGGVRPQAASHPADGKTDEHIYRDDYFQ